MPSETSLGVGRRKLAVDVAEATELGPVKTSDPKGPYWRKKPTQVITFFQFPAEIRTLPGSWGVSGFLCLGRLFQGQPNEAALCFL